MEAQLKDYFFRIELNSEFQVFWITHDILKICPDAELDIDTNEQRQSTLSLVNCNLSLSQIQFVFIENQIGYEKISQFR